jgi:hypothetical protein
MNRRAGISSILSAGLLLFAPALVMAEENSEAERLVRSVVAACSERALSDTLRQQEEFDWPFSCQEKPNEACFAAVRSDADPANDANAQTTCREYERPAWKDVADALKARLVARWEGCDLTDKVKSEMIGKIYRLDAAMGEFAAAHCDYDAGQWLAVEEPGTANYKLLRCRVSGETTRAAVFFQLLLKDVGCGDED